MFKEGNLIWVELFHAVRWRRCAGAGVCIFVVVFFTWLAGA